MLSNSTEQLKLKKNEVHVWIIQPLLQPDILKNQFVLSNDEKERASKFRFERDRETFITGRVALRILLSNYLSIDPKTIVFKYNDQRKPEFKNEEEINFNLSNSVSTIAIAIVKKYLIGIDIEYNKRPIKIDEIAPKFFATNEVTKLRSVDRANQLNAFYNCWTRKESFIKALGGGLSIPLDQFEVSLLDEEAPSIKHIQWDEKDVENWKMEHFNIGDDYTGAVLTRNRSAVFELLSFDQKFLNLSISSIN